MKWHFAFVLFNGLCHISRSALCADGENRHPRGYELRAQQSSDELFPCKRNRRTFFFFVFSRHAQKMLACIDLACCSSPTVFSGGSAFLPNPREVSARCKQRKNPGKSSMSRCRQHSNPGMLGCRQHRKPGNFSMFRCKQQAVEKFWKLYLSISRCRQHRNPGNLGIFGQNPGKSSIFRAYSTGHRRCSPQF